MLELSKPNMRHLTESLVPALMIFNKRSNKLRQRPPLFSIHMIALITVRGLSDGRPTFTQLLNKNFILLHCLSFTSFKLILSLLMFFIYLGLPTTSNPNIDLSRSHLNHCTEELTPDRLNSRVNSRIKQLHLKRKPRSVEDIIISASAEFMLTVDDEVREKYFADALHFLQERYVKENVM